MPALRTWVDSSLDFRQAWSPSPFTLPSHMTVFTGAAPIVHGVQRHDLRLSRKIRTIPELLKSAGYRTAGIANSPWLSAGFGFGRGFDSYEVVPPGTRIAPEIGRRALAELESAAGGGPLFLFLHLYDAHSLVGSRESPWPYLGEGSDLDAMRDQLRGEDFCTVEGACATDFLLTVNREASPVTQRALTGMKSLYGVAVERLARDVAALLDAITATERGREALIILFSDHGEEFREHGRFLHSQVWTECARIPLVVRDGRRGGAGNPREPVELADVFTTVVEAAGVESTVPAWQRGGRNLLTIGERPDSARRVLLIQDKLHLKVFGGRSGQWTLVWDGRDGSHELYDRGADAGELHDLAAVDVERAAALRREVELHVRKLRSARVPPETWSEDEGIGDEQLKSLRALGYLQ